MRISFYGFIYVSYSEMLGNDRLFRLNLATKFVAVGLGMCRDLALFGWLPPPPQSSYAPKPQHHRLLSVGDQY